MSQSHQIPELEGLTAAMEALGAHVRDSFVNRRSALTTAEMASVSHHSPADTIYMIDREIEEAIVQWLRAQWPKHFPVQLIMEGLDEASVFPEDREPLGCLIIDPIDGTREIMWDRRSAWFLAGLAPIGGQPRPRLNDLQAAVMVELPPTRQRGSYRISARRGEGVRSTFLDFVRGEIACPLPSPHPGHSLEHGYSGIFSPGPEAKGAIGEFVERLLAAYEQKPSQGLSIFDDQYTSTGGQLFDLMTGRLRLYGDLRPYFISSQVGTNPFVCHPYDICTALIAEEAGCVVEQADGTPLGLPLDTTSPVAWMGYANRGIADKARPIVQSLLPELRMQRQA